MSGDTEHTGEITNASDKARWNARYREGAYAERTHPSDYLRANLARFAPGAAADVACGLGRNAIYLAQHGFRVTGYDVSDVALNRAAVRSRALALQVEWRQRDLIAQGLPADARYDLIVMVRFVAPKLVAQLHAHLNPGGSALLEQHLLHAAPDLAGPSSPRFRVAPGELVSQCASLQIVEQFEGIVEDPDGRRAAVARVIARRVDDTQTARNRVAS